jgi:hypothetical protein
MTIKENGQFINDLKITRDCESNSCPQTDAVDNILLETEEYNPYATTGEKSYVFTVSVKNSKGEHVGKSPCTVPLTITDVKASCK